MSSPKRKLATALASALLAAAPLALHAEEKVDLVMLSKIRDEGFNRSKAMDTLSEMCDQNGPRLTGSPGMKKAADWAQKKLSGWGLANTHAESFSGVRGWTWERARFVVKTPAAFTIRAIPQAWTPGTNGPLRGTPVFAPLESLFKESTSLDEWTGKWKGKLAGKILLVSPEIKAKPHEKPDWTRASEESLDKISRFEPGDGPWGDDPQGYIKFIDKAERFRKFLEEEKVAAVVNASYIDDGTIHADGTYQVRKEDGLYPPSIVISKEDYGRLSRLVKRASDGGEGVAPVDVELEVKATLLDEDPAALANIVAEIPGTDPKLKDEVVLLGAHFDSWHGGTGATDNGAGSAAVMEALRILKAVGAKPRRTIRVALWNGEEQGLFGSWAYVTKHLATRPEPTDPDQLKLWPQARKFGGPLELKPEHAKLAAYFNLDNGGGAIRGIYCQENSAVAPIFEAWLRPLSDLGASTVTLRNTNGTDHLSFDTVGAPGFQFIQDDLDYGSRSHHTDMDTVERVPKNDLMQSSVILASFAYNAAMRDEKLPRKALPQYKAEDGKKKN